MPVGARLRGVTIQKDEQLPESKAGKAVAYMLNQWAHLELFLGNPKVPLDNNASERALRGSRTAETPLCLSATTNPARISLS